MRLMTLLFMAAAFCSSGQVLAQGYAWRPIRVIQPLGVGSPGDLVSRAVAQSLSQALGQPVVVENRVGANGIIDGRSIWETSIASATV